MTIQARQRKSHGSIHLPILLKVITFYNSSNKSNIILSEHQGQDDVGISTKLLQFTSTHNTLFNNQKCASLAILEQYVFLQ